MMRAVVGSREETALDAARDRFVDGLFRKAGELRSVAQRLSLPGVSAPVEADLRRRLASIHASAQVFRLDGLAETLGAGLASLDASPEATADERIARFGALAASLEAFARAAGRVVPESRTPAAPTLVGVALADPSTRSLAPEGMLEALDDAEVEADAEGVVDASVAPQDATTRPGDVLAAARAAGLVQGRPTTEPPEPPARRASLPPPVDGVLSVLVVGPLSRRLASGLPKDRVETLGCEADVLLVTARVAAPDVLLVDGSLLDDDTHALLEGLRASPSTDLVPVVAVSGAGDPDPEQARRLGVDELVSVHTPPEALAAKLARLAGVLPATRPAELGVRTVAEVADRMADELRRGLVDAVEIGADEPLALGDGTELFAAAWTAIARMRTTLVDRAGGRVRFRDADRRGGPRILALGGDASRGASGPDVDLRGRRILVADDDPAVRWFFVGLLQDAGADVFEAPDGEAALDLARKTSPDLVLTDILMPRMDGLSLGRELARDAVLAETPVIYLSWKEDFLQRLRELRAGGAGYLRKEEGAQIVLDRVRDALRSKVRFEARLREGGEVRGRVEGLGVLSILRSTARLRMDARVTVRDVHNQFEIDLRRGRIVGMLRTSADGTFARGEAALASLLGVTAGRFAVLPPVIGDRPAVAPIGPEVIERAAARLGALVDSVTGRRIAAAERIELDADVVAALLAVAPPQLVDVVRRLERDPSARRWLVSGEVDPEALTAALAELARRGAVRGVWGADGEDRIAEALARRLGAEVEAARPRTDPPPHAPRSSDPEVELGAPEPLSLEDEPSASEAAPSTSGDVPGSVELPPLGVVGPPVPQSLAVDPRASEHARARRRREGPDDTIRVFRHAPRERDEGGRIGPWLVLGVVAIGLVTIGLGYLASRTPTTAGAAPVPAASTQRSAPANVARGARAATDRPADPWLDGTSLADPSIAAPGLGPDEAAIVVEGGADGVEATVDDMPVGAWPWRGAPGTHRVELRQGDRVRIRFLRLVAGEVRALPRQ